MDANRTYLLAQNGVPGEYIAGIPVSLLRQSLSANLATTMQRRDSFDSLDSIARAKAEAHTASKPRSVPQSSLFKVPRRIFCAGKEKHLTGAQAAVVAGSVKEHGPFQVYVIGDQVVYLGQGRNSHSRKESERKREQITNAGMERVKAAKEKRMSVGHWSDGG